MTAPKNSFNKSKGYYFFTNHQKRQIVDLKECPCIIYVKNCLEYEFQKHQYLDTEIQ